MRAGPKAKRSEFFSLAVPVGLSGRFDDFGIDINPVVLTGKAISFVTSPLHVPVRRIFRKGEPTDGEQACTDAWHASGPFADQASTSGQVSGQGQQAPPPSFGREAEQRIGVSEQGSGKRREEREDDQDSSPRGSFETE